MYEWLQQHLNDSGFMPHGHCFLWSPKLLYLMVASDIGIALAYFVIPIWLLVSLSHPRVRELRGLIFLFCAFIWACGITHVVQAWNIWNFSYWVEAWVKAGTAVISIYTAIRLFTLVPQLVNLPSQNELRNKNTELSRQLDIIREQEEALRDSEMRYRQVVETASEGIWVLDNEAYTTFVNRSLADMLGYEPDEMKGTHLFQYMDEAGRQQATENMRRRREGVVERHDFRFFRKDGTQITTIVSTSPIYDAEGAVQGLLGVVTDITDRELIARDLARLTADLEARVNERTAELAESTQRLQDEIEERRKAEERYREKEQNLRAIFNGTVDGIIILDQQGSIESFNPAAEKLFGYDANDIIGREVSLLMPPQHRLLHEEYINSFVDNPFNERGGTQQEVEGLRRDGTIFPIELTISAVDIEGEFKFVDIVRDITERKGAEVNIRSLNADLALRTAEMIAANQRLEREVNDRSEAEHALQEANERLQDSLKRLRRHTEDMQKLNDLAEMLQTGKTLAEASQIIGHAARELMPDSEGIVYLARPMERALEATEHWGTELRADERLIALDDCWSLRLGKPFYSPASNPNLRCRHAKGNEAKNTLCIPLHAQGQLVGTVHLRGEQLESLEDPDLAGLIQGFAEHSALGLSNIKLRESLQTKSERDELTGLYNRRFLQEQLIIEHARAQRALGRYALLIADIDHFKRFNDEFGHDVGDHVLRKVAKEIDNCSRDGDIVARYGGEEFTIFLQVDNSEEASLYAERLREAVAHDVELGEGLPRVTLSIGVALYPFHGDNWQRVLKAADEALYQAKESGRNRVCVASAASFTGDNKTGSS